MKKIYQVEIKAINADGDNTFNTHLFTDRETAENCVDHLYKNRFAQINDWRTNPFSNYEEDEQNYVNEKMVMVDGKVIKFELFENFDCTNLSVKIVEKELDTDFTKWKF